MSGYRDLEIYQLAKKLAIEIHHFSLKLPKYELYEIGSQIRRASTSIVFNIAEGFGRRRYKAEYIRFLIFSQASCDEVFSQLELLSELYPEIDIKNLIVSCNTLGKKINSYIQFVEHSWKT